MLLFMVCASAQLTYAQHISLKKVTFDINDIWARQAKNVRVDKDGKNCAVIKVGIVGVKDLTFPDAVGDVTYSQSEYTVYVSPGLKSFKYANKAGTATGTVDLSKFLGSSEQPFEGAQPQALYRVYFDTESHLRAAIFSIAPQTAVLTFDGKQVVLDAEGMASVDKPVGTYQYKVTANGYETQSGTVKLTADEISTTTDISLEAITHTVAFSGLPSNVSLFIDDAPYTGPLNDVEMTEGQHNIRFIAEGYDDYEQIISVRDDISNMAIAMQQKKQQVIKFTEERTRRKSNLPPGYYLTVGGNLFEKEKNLAQEWSLAINFSAMQHFGGIFAVREGIGIGYSHLNDSIMKEVYETVPKDTSTFYVDVPLQIGISFPFGAYNQHAFSILGGGYGKYLTTKIEEDAKGKTSKDKWDYGLRLTAMVDIKWFTIGAEVSRSLNGYGMSYGITLGWKLSKKDLDW